ncbi:MAG: penicillin-binding protein 1C [Luteolibacter sp.]
MKRFRITPRRLLKILVCCVLTAGLGWFALPFALPLPQDLIEETPASPIFLDRHGAPISRLALPDAVRSAPVKLEDIPQDFIDCTLAAEDKRFFEHGGVDLLAISRAATDLIRHRRPTSGASTITQQLIKISSPPAKRHLGTKLREALLARRLEMSWDKNRILATYLNRLDYGNLRRGAAEAARFYFQKPLSDLSLAECALLAGLPQAPTRLNPLKRPERALARRNIILSRLAKNRPALLARTRTASTEPLTLRPLKERNPAPWLARFSSSGGRQKTTLDLSLQNEISTIVREETAKWKSANLRHAAVVVIHNPTGEILALVSSASWHDPRGGQINGAISPRSPGSTLKPFTYLLAMERNGRLPGSILADIPTPFKTPQGLSVPENYDRTYRGPVTLRTALACSLNLPALRETNALGGPAPLAEFLRQLGIQTLNENPAEYGIGLTLGNAPVSLLELTNAYATLAREGRFFPPRLFLDQELSPASELPVEKFRIFLITDILADSAARAPSFPPGGPLDFPFPCAVKTGTSSDFRDNWCVGYTPEFTVGVWAGNFEQQPMKGISGITGAGPIFHRSMLAAHRREKPTWFTYPSSLIPIVIDTRTGKRLPEETLAHHRFARRDFAPTHQLPPDQTSADLDPSGKALLPALYQEWFDSPYNQRRGELTLDPAIIAREPLRISIPANDSTYLLDPEMPSSAGRLRPVTNMPGSVRWHSDTLKILNSATDPVILLSPGTHQLTATDERNGTTQTFRIHVKSL